MLYLIIDKRCEDRVSFQQIIRQINAQTQEKHIRIQTITELSEISNADNSAVLFLMSTSVRWVLSNAELAARSSIRAVALTCFLPYNIDVPCSSICSDVAGAMYDSIYYLKNLRCSKIAFFGASRTSSYEIPKINVYNQLLGNEFIFYQEATIAESYEHMRPYISDLDGIICSSDYIAIALIRHLHLLNNADLQHLHIVSFGNSAVISHAHPAIVSVEYDFDEIGNIVISLYKMLTTINLISHITIKMKTSLRNSASEKFSARSYFSMNSHLSNTEAINHYAKDPDIIRISNLDNLLSKSDETDLKILSLLHSKHTYSYIADNCYISEATVKYRLKRMKSLSKTKSIDELLSLLDDFVVL